MKPTLRERIAALPVLCMEFGNPCEQQRDPEEVDQILQAVKQYCEELIGEIQQDLFDEIERNGKKNGGYMIGHLNVRKVIRQQRAKLKEDLG